MNKLIVLTAILLSYVGLTKAQSYCSPSFSSGCVFNNYINYVSVGGMTNSASGCGTSDYTNKKAKITAGDTISMTVRTAGWDGVAVFVDLNNDGDMTDAGEKLYSQYTANSPPITYNFTITVPANTSAGNHRFRVNCGNGGSASCCGPCVSTSYGNFHDYTLEVTNNCPTDSNLQVNNITPSSADFSWAARNVNQYQYVLDTNAADPTMGFTNTSLTNVSVSSLTNGQRYYFHIRSDCGNGIYSSWGKISFVACDVPDATITPNGTVDLCRGDTITLSVPNDTSANYQWYMNGGKMIGQTKNFIDVSVFPATYHVEAETFAGCISVSEKVVVHIHNKPKAPGIGASGFLVFTEGGFATYDWYLDGNLLVSNTDSTHMATANGTYHVIVTDTNGCSATTESIGITGVGILDHNQDETLEIYPNPSNGVVNIMAPVNGMSTLVIYDLEGKTIHNQRFSKQQVDLSHLDPGLYFVRLTGDQNLSARILIK